MNVKSRSLICPALNSALHWQHPCPPPNPAFLPAKPDSPPSQEPPFQSDLASLVLNMQLTSSYLLAFVMLLTPAFFCLDPIHSLLPPSSPFSSRKLTFPSSYSFCLLDAHSVCVCAWGRVPDTVYVVSSFFAAVLQNRLCCDHFPPWLPWWLRR